MRLKYWKNSHQAKNNYQKCRKHRTTNQRPKKRKKCEYEKSTPVLEDERVVCI
jgi:hypothetical protein